MPTSFAKLAEATPITTVRKWVIYWTSYLPSGALAYQQIREGNDGFHQHTELKLGELGLGFVLIAVARWVNKQPNS